MDGKYVFISYKVEEFDQALEVKEHLEANRIPCWMAPMSIPGGSSYAQEIPQAIRGCGVFVLILSEVCQQSKWVPRELDQAINCSKTIMPYILENCQLRSDFSFYLSNVQRYDAFRNPEKVLARMTGDIQELLGIAPVEPEEPKAPEAPEEPKQPEPVPEKKKTGRKAVKKEKKPADRKKKRLLPWILGGALVLLALAVALLIPRKLTLGGVAVERDSYTLRLENVTLTQADVNKLAKFKNLSGIHLNNCTLQAQDLAPMVTENITTLELKACDLTDAQFATVDFSVARHFYNLYVAENPELTDLKGLEACGDTLYGLDISDTGIRSFDWLPAFSKLTEFRADRTGLQDTTVLEAMIYLEKLSLSGNGITSLEGLKNTSKLSEVDLSHNQLADVSILGRSAASLNVLHLEDNALTDLSCLEEASQLAKVYVDENELTDLDWLGGREKLRILSASQNHIQSLSGLKLNNSFCYLNLSDNRIETIDTGDLVFKTDSYLVVDLHNNELTNLQLPEDCTYKQLVLLGNPKLNLLSLKDLDGWDVYFHFPLDANLVTLTSLPFSRLCIVDCPLDRQVEIEEGLSNECLMTEAEVLEEIAEKTADADY